MSASYAPGNTLSLVVEASSRAFDADPTLGRPTIMLYVSLVFGALPLPALALAPAPLRPVDWAPDPPEADPSVGPAMDFVCECGPRRRPSIPAPRACPHIGDGRCRRVRPAPTRPPRPAGRYEASYVLNNTGPPEVAPGVVGVADAPFLTNFSAMGMRLERFTAEGVEGLVVAYEPACGDMGLHAQCFRACNAQACSAPVCVRIQVFGRRS